MIDILTKYVMDSTKQSTETLEIDYNISTHY